MSFPLFAVPVDQRLLLLFTDAFTGGGTFATGGGRGGGGGSVISVLVEVATNICGLDSEATSPSGRGIGFICVFNVRFSQFSKLYKRQCNKTKRENK